MNKEARHGTRSGRCARQTMEHHPTTRPSPAINSARLTRASVLASLLLLLTAAISRADYWPQWRGPHRDGVWREQGLLQKFESPKIKIRWRVPVSSGYN